MAVRLRVALRQASSERAGNRGPLKVCEKFLRMRHYTKKRAQNLLKCDMIKCKHKPLPPAACRGGGPALKNVKDENGGIGLACL